MLDYIVQFITILTSESIYGVYNLGIQTLRYILLCHSV